MRGGALLLAAGASRRFGSDKRTHRMGDGDPLLHATAAKYAACFKRVVVVLRPGDAELETALVTRFGERSPRIIIAAEADLGMGHSLAAGISAVADWDYAFVGLADMPFVKTQTLTRLRQAMEVAADGAIIQPTLQGKPGHPVGFGRAHFDAMKSLTGDAGARSIVKKFQAKVIEVPVTDAGVLRDVDRPADLAG